MTCQVAMGLSTFPNLHLYSKNAILMIKNEDESRRELLLDNFAHAGKITYQMFWKSTV